MTSKTFSILFITTILMTAAVASSVNVIQDVEAVKGKGVGSSKYGSQTDVCGLQLCSEIPGGRAAFEEGKTGGSPAEHVKQMNKETMEETMKDTNMVKKDHGYQTASSTITSIQDPGVGHESHQLAIILPPSDKTYKGILTYDASEPIQLVSLHGPLAEGEDKGQAIWTPDGETKFALTFVDPETSMGTWLFAGNALAVHTKNTEEFTVSYSVAAGSN